MLMGQYSIHREVLEMMYTGRCSVYEYRDREDKVTKVTSKQETEVLTDIPCFRSYSGISTTSTSAGAAEAGISARLFLAPETEIKPGSKIVIKQDGLTEYYSSSGRPAVYPTHQEIMLAAFERWV